MKFRKFGSHYVVRVDRGEELVESLKEFCRKSGVKLAMITGIGATDRVKIGLFDVSTKEFHQKELTGPHEITSVLGNITTKNGEPYLHLHINLADAKHHAFGGHLVSARISATFEGVVVELPGEVERFFDGNLGLNLLKL
jgi:predicted DNA-binding protein with PD1-like motif